MFIEPVIDRQVNKNGSRGWIEVICGPMFSGKTEELIRRINRAIIAGQEVEIYKSEIDKRYDPQKVVSHNQASIRSTVVGFANEIVLLADHCQVVGIDEAQFFDAEIVKVVNELANRGKRIIVAGLDLDSKGLPFGKMPELMAHAEYVTKLHAICVRCGDLASFSYRIKENEKQIMLGSQEAYEPRCRRCFNLGKNAKKLI